MQNNLRLQSNYAKTQVQIASGLKSTQYADIATDSSRLLNLESDYERILQQTENTKLAIDRTEIMFDALGSIIDQTQEFVADLYASVSGTGAQGSALSNIAQTNLQQVAGGLNTQVSGRYLFAGAATKTSPVDLNDPAWGGQIFVLPGPSVADTNYYQGDNYIQSVEAADGFTVNYGITADNTAFEKIIRGYDLIVTNPTDTDTLYEALRIMEQAVDEVAVLKASLSQDTQTLDSQVDANLLDINLIDTQISDIQDVDLAEATVRLKQYESQLEASYSVTSDLLNLSLLDFIK
jgi:flagellar hook-associated protein 3 FlgL